MEESVSPEKPEKVEQEELPNWADYTDENDVDVTLVDWMLSLTPIERLRFLQNHANAIIRLRNAASNE